MPEEVFYTNESEFYWENEELFFFFFYGYFEIL